MHKVLIVCVNYNSYQELSSYLDSINGASKREKLVSVKVIVADNSPSLQVQSYNGYDSIDVETRHFDNLGYLGAAQSIINSSNDIREYDYIVISNVDLTLKKDFFEQLASLHFDEDVAMIAPQIWSEEEHRDRNPKIISRYSRTKLKILQMFYRYPILDRIYTRTAYQRKKKFAPTPERDIYAGHGSFMMLTRTFIERCARLQYPIFLFSEEIYIAELIRSSALRVRYQPKLTVFDSEHISTGKMKKSFYYQCNEESLSYILKTFYNE